MQALECSLWRARQTRLERNVLVLIFNDEAKANPETLSVRLRMIQRLANVHTTLFPEIVDILRSDEDVYVVLEDPKVVAILDVLEARPLGVQQALRLMTALVDGFTRLEQLHVSYGCVRPKALYLTEDNLPIFPDISLVRFGADDAECLPMDFSEGMAPYLAPEQYQSNRLLQNAQTEMYALAMTMYALMTGQIPYGALSPEEILEVKCRQALPSAQDIVKGVPPAFTHILMRMAQRHPADRYPDWDAVRFDLHQLSVGVEVPCFKPEGSTFALPTGTRSRMRVKLMYRKRALRASKNVDFHRKSWFFFPFLIGCLVLVSLVIVILLIAW